MDSVIKSFALILTGIMAISCMSILMVKPVNAQSTPSPEITILYPTNGTFFNVSIGVDSFHLKYTTDTPLSWIGYSIDGGQNKTAYGEWYNIQQILYDAEGNPSVRVSGVFEGDGNHNLTLYANNTAGDWATPQTVTYLVNINADTTFPPPNTSSPSPFSTVPISSSPTPSPFVPAPSLDIIHPQNFTYSGESAKAIPLMIYATVLVDAPAVVSISYSLDESQNITFTDLLKTGEFPSQSGKAIAYHTEMLSLSNLTDGTHVLKTYSLDTSGNVMKNNVEFTVDLTPMPTVNPSPHTPQTFPVLVAALIVIAVVIALVLLFRWHRKPVS